MTKTIYILLIFLITSCSNNASDEIQSIHTFTAEDLNSEIYAIRDEIIEINSSLSVETKLNLSFIDYMFKYPERYERLKELPRGFDKSCLTSDVDFIEICEAHKLPIDSINNYIYLNASND